MRSYGVDINLNRVPDELSRYRLRYLTFRHINDVGDNEIINDTIDYNDITVIFKGKMEYIINGSPVVVNSNEMLYLPAGTKRYRTIQDGTAEYCSVNFWLVNGFMPDIPKCIPYKISVEMNEIIYKLCSVYNSQETNLECKCVALLSLFLIYAVENYDLKSCNETVEKIKHYIKNNWSINPTLEEISTFIKYHPVHCCRLFRRYEGCSISDYISCIRLNHVKDLLIYSKKSISEIADNTNLSEYYFCRWFRKQTGLTPTEYRKRYKILVRV